MELFVFVMLDVRDLGLVAGGREVSPMDERETAGDDICFIGDFIGDCTRKENNNQRRNQHNWFQIRPTYLQTWSLLRCGLRRRR